MPYDPSDPPEKLKKLPAKKQRQWIHVFNSCLKNGGDDEQCHQMAWGVVRKSMLVENMKAELALVNLEKFAGIRVNDDTTRAVVKTLSRVIGGMQKVLSGRCENC